MRWRGWITLIAIGALPLTLFLFSRPPISFTRLQEAKTHLEAAGYHCTTDAINSTGGGFMVTREAVSHEEVYNLPKVGKMGPAWKERLWVTASPQRFSLEMILDDAASRLWGEIVVFGDGEFLDEVECNLP